MTRREKKEQEESAKKGILTDILEDIHIEESLVEQPVEVTATETKMKIKRESKLYFN